MARYNFDTVIERRGAMCRKWETYPEDVLPMWVADSDFKAPQEIIDALAKRVQNGAFGYSLNDGSFEKAAVLWMKKRFGWNADPAWAEFLPSIGTAMAIAVKAFSKPGDFVLMQTPLYPPFTAVTKYNDRVPLNNPLIWREGNYQIDFEDFEKKAADPKTTLFFLCNPHNPSGRAFTEAELRRMGEICIKHNVTVFSDEIHCDYVFSGHKHICFPTLGPEFEKMCAVGINPSKTFNIADLRTAALIIPDEELRNHYKHELTACKLGRCTLGITGFITAYEQCDIYADEVCAYIEANMKFAADYVNRNIPGISTFMPDATYLLWLDCRKLGKDQKELVRFFLEDAKVAMNSGEAFGDAGKGFMRMNLACPRSLVEEGLRRIEKAVKAL